MPALAAFDFDRTLTRRDTFVPFLRAVAGPRALAMAGAGAFRQGAGALRSRDLLKEHLCATTLRGRSRADLDRIGMTYARSVLARGMRPDSLARLQWHQEHGHTVVVVSAGLRSYLSVIADELGLDDLLCTTLEFDDDDRATGALVDGNCRGPEKARRLETWWADHGGRPDTLWVYGDSAGDAELLALADHPVRVGRKLLPVLSPAEAG